MGWGQLDGPGVAEWVNPRSHSLWGQLWDWDVDEEEGASDTPGGGRSERASTFHCLPPNTQAHSLSQARTEAGRQEPALREILLWLHTPLPAAAPSSPHRCGSGMKRCIIGCLGRVGEMA